MAGQRHRLRAVRGSRYATIAQRRQYGFVYVFDPRDPDTDALNPPDGVAAQADRISKILASAMLEKDLVNLR